MKQVLQNLRTGNLEVAEVPVPSPLAGETLVRTTSSLVSAGTERAMMELAERSLLGKARARPDLVHKVIDKARREGPVAAARSAFARLDQPIPLGYSCCGVVEALGDGVTDLAVGDLVACAGAGIANHAEFNSVPRPLLARVPAGVAPEAAAFVTLGAVALHGVRLLDLTLGERVLVVGAGLIGQLAAQIVTASGGTVYVVDPDAARVRTALALGALAGPAEGVDAILLCAAGDSNEPLEVAAAAARDRARIVAVGASKLEVPRRAFYEKELSLRVSRAYGPGRYDSAYEEGRAEYPIGYVRWTLGRNLEAFLDLAATGRVRTEPLVTHRFAIARADEAYGLLREGREPFLGVVLTYPDRSAPASHRVTLRAAAPAGRGRVGVAVIGAGAFAGAVLVPAIAAQRAVDRQVVVSARGISARHLAVRHDFASSSTAVEDAFTDPDVQAVFISTRHDAHSDLAIRALNAGKDVFVEKPLALGREELAHVLEALHSSGRRLMVGYNRRFSPLAVRLRDHFAGRRGPLFLSYRIAVPKVPADHWVRDPVKGGGRIVGEVCHFVDLACFVAGAVPLEVFARAPQGSGDEDVAITLTLADGSISSILYETVGDAAMPKERLEVHGAERSAILDDWRHLELWRGARRKRSTGLSQHKGHAEEVEAFVRSVQSGLPSPIIPTDLAAVSLATFATLESLASGLPIRLDAEPPR